MNAIHQKNKPGAAATASEPRSTNSQRGNHMNAQTISTAPVRPATGKSIWEIAEETHSEIIALRHMLTFLLADLEFGLSEQRGKVDGETVSLIFQRGKIESTLWLVSSAWLKAMDLDALLNSVAEEAE